MSTLHDRLADLASDVDAIAPERPPRETFGAARRAARRERLLAVATVLVVGVLVAALLWPGGGARAVRPADGVGPGEALSLPQRFAKPWVARDLPDAPGRAAAVVQEAPTLEPGWLVMPDGRVWRIPSPDPVPATGWYLGLSPDGRRLTRLDADHRFLLHDLVTGDRRVVDLSEAGMSSWSGNVRVLWTPDSSRVLVADSDFAGNTFTVDPVGVVVDPVTGATTRVPGWYPEGIPAARIAGLRVAGWQDESTVLALLPQGPGDTGGILLRWRMGDAGWSDTGILVPSNVLETGAGQGLGSVGIAPDGRTLYSLVTMPEPFVLHVVDPATGAERRRIAIRDPASWSWLGWRGDRPVYRQAAFADVVPVTTAPDGLVPAPFVLDPRFAPWNIEVAQAALDGPVHEMLGGTADSALSWYWRQALATLVAAVLGFVLVLRRHRRAY